MQDRNTVADVLAAKKITAEDVLALRRSTYHDGVAERGEVERLFTMDEAATTFDPSWTELFTEAVADHIVNQTQPNGHISEANANWLIERIGRDGVVKTTNELELLVKVLEKAMSSPERLAAYALEQVKHAAVDGDGPLVRGNLERGRVNRDEVELIRRILYAFGGHGNVAVTRSEAEVLFEINDATAAAENDPAWSDLFVKAIANFMMAASGYAVPSREEALKREAWLDSPSGGVGDFIGKMAAGGLRGVLKAYREPNTDAVWAERNTRFEAAQASSLHVTADEAEWLARRMGRDGALHDNEKALLRFIRDEAPSIHPSLKSLIAKAA